MILGSGLGGKVFDTTTKTTTPQNAAAALLLLPAQTTTTTTTTRITADKLYQKGGSGGGVLERIDYLHSRLRDDYSARGLLDCHLLALCYSERAPPHWMVLDYSDTFHYFNLPDLMFIIRSTFMGLCPSTCLQKLFNMFLCGKRYRRLLNTNNNMCQLTSAIVNTLHGLLLGLYPFNERRMDLQKRAWLAGTLRAVLTDGDHSDFTNKHQYLMCLSLMEYIVNAVEDFCPVEWALLGISASAKSQCLASFEAFREATVALAVGEVDFWSKLEADAQGIVSSLVKFFRGASFYQHRPKSVLASSHTRHLSLAMETRVIQNSSSIFGQLRAAIPNIDFYAAESLEEIWTTVYIRCLPAYTTMKQMSALERIGGMCWFLEQQLHTFPLCLLCALTRRTDVLKSLFRYDCVDGGLVCNECMNLTHVVNVNLLGRVLYVRDKAIVLCERCLRPKCWDATCSCELEDASSANGCCVCQNSNVFSSKDVIDIDAMRMQSVGFCYKHSLSCIVSDATVYDLKTLEKEVHNRRSSTNYNTGSRNSSSSRISSSSTG